MLNNIKCGCGKNKVEHSQVYKTAVANLIYLLGESPKHRQWRLSSFARVFAPALQLKQYKFWFEDKTPVGFVCWMWLSEEASKKYANTVGELQPSDWSLEGANTNLWISELISVGGDVRQIIKWLHRKFPDRQAYHKRFGKFNGDIRGKFGKRVQLDVAS